LDIAISTDCPFTNYALNITQSRSVQIGDEVVCYGYGSISNSWTGNLAGIYNNTNIVQYPPWTGDGTICPNELIFQGAQHGGLSGSGILNGCCYVGTAHILFTKEIQYCLVIPADEIRKCINANVHKLKSNCPIAIESPIMLKGC